MEEETPKPKKKTGCGGPRPGSGRPKGTTGIKQSTEPNKWANILREKEGKPKRTRRSKPHNHSAAHKRNIYGDLINSGEARARFLEAVIKGTVDGEPPALRDRIQALKLLQDLDPIALRPQEAQRIQVSFLQPVVKEPLQDPEPQEPTTNNLIDLKNEVG